MLCQFKETALNWGGGGGGAQGEIEFNIKSNLNKKIVSSASRSVHLWPRLSENGVFYRSCK